MTDVFWISVVWVALSIGGLAVGFVSLGEASADRRALRESGKNGVRLIVARAALVTEATRMALQFLIVLMGVGSLLNPITSEARAPLVYVAVLGTAIIVFNSVYSLMVRRAVIKGAAVILVKLAEQETLLEVQRDMAKSADVADLAKRATASEHRADVAEHRADDSEDRADISEHRADAAEERENA